MKTKVLNVLRERSKALHIFTTEATADEDISSNNTPENKKGSTSHGSQNFRLGYRALDCCTCADKVYPGSPNACVNSLASSGGHAEYGAVDGSF